MKKTQYIQPLSVLVELRLSDSANQFVPIFGEGSKGGGPGIADGKDMDFEENDEDEDNAESWRQFPRQRVFDDRE